MRLTSSSLDTASDGPAYPWCSRSRALIAVVIGLAGIYALDRATGDAPVQHLYYLPIIVAALAFGSRGGIAASLAAIILYHLANESLFTPGRAETDIVQIALFIAVGVATARLANDADRLRRLATTDDLTGLHNLRSFEAGFAEMLRVARQEKVPLSLLMLDVDHLKFLNDRYGHLAGAEAVRTVGQIIAAHVPSGAVACRYGGDEFVIALPRCTAARAEEIAVVLRQAVSAAAPVLAGHHLPAATLAISVGVACRARDAQSLRAVDTEDREGEALFRSADDALYRAKASGRNRVCSA